MNLLKNCFYVRIKYQLIKSIYRYWLLRFSFQSLTDINPDFWKLYFTTTETPNCLRNGIFWKISSALFTRYQQINLEHV